MNKVVSKSSATMVVAGVALLLVLLSSSPTAVAFVPSYSSFSSVKSHIIQQQQPPPHQRIDTRRFINLGEKEREALTRDSEPENFFATNTDKMSDEEKIPLAIAGVAFITLPFIAGLIALFSNQ